VRTLRLARELLDGHALTKLEVLGDPQSLYPNMPETIKAAETLVKEGFEVMVYCSDDPIQARVLESIGCVAVMPLASLIGSGMGILNPWNIQLILERATVPVIVDAGVGTGQRRGDRDGTRLRRRADEHGGGAGEGPGTDGERDEEGGRSRARGLSRRPHAEAALSGTPSSPTTGVIAPSKPGA